MITFHDGPARGQRLMSSEAPLFLRAAFDGRAWSALADDDIPKSEEQLHAYARSSGEPGRCFVTGPKMQEWTMIASYTLCDPQPPAGVLRDNDRWHAWCQGF